MDILGVRVDNLAKNDALIKAKSFLYSGQSHIIFTPNPEMIVAAQKDRYFREVLNKGDLNLCDGRGIQLVANEKIDRIAGVDFMILLCELAAAEKKSIYLLGSGKVEVVEGAKQKLLEKFPNLDIVGVNPGITITLLSTGHIEYSSEQNDALLENIILASPQILCVAFGHIKQEKWIYENLPHLPSVKIAIGIGGAFDFISGTVKRAPKILQFFGLEWLYRLFQEPKRIKRMYNATFVFLWYNLKKFLET